MMPTQNFRRVDLDRIYAPFLGRVLEVIAACNERGYTYIATRGWDSYGKQMDLWAQGRTRPGPIVTNAKGGQSAHNFGLAMDFVRDIDAKPGVQPSWKPEDYEVLIEEAEKRRLHSGRGYKDFPHLSWPGYVTASDLKPLDLVWRSASGDELTRLREVWKATLPLSEK